MIQVESAPGRGSRIRVWLPALGPTSAASEPVAVAARDWRGSGTILVVDDEEAVRAAVTSMLELLGFEVICAADGLEAIELFGSLSAPPSPGLTAPGHTSRHGRGGLREAFAGFGG